MQKLRKERIIINISNFYLFNENTRVISIEIQEKRFFGWKKIYYWWEDLENGRDKIWNCINEFVLRNKREERENFPKTILPKEILVPICPLCNKIRGEEK